MTHLKMVTQVLGDAVKEIIRGLVTENKGGGSSVEEVRKGLSQKVTLQPRPP